MLTILYVDDEPALLDIVKLFLERTGDFTVITAESAKEAINIINTTKIDLIISDYEMPIMNGIELLITLREAGNTTPFVIYTGRGRMEVVIQALEAGAESYIQKGEGKNQFQDLLTKIQKVLRWKVAEEEVRRKSREWEGIFHSIGEVVLIIDPDCRITAANTIACQLFGMTEQEIIGSNARDLLNSGISSENNSLIRALETGIYESGEFTSERLNKTFLISSTPILDDGGKVEKVILIATDITERKRVEKELMTYRNHLEELVRERTHELAIAKDEAETANKAKSTFLSNMSHELRTPLNAILGYTQILSRNDNLTETQKVQLKTVYSSGKHLLSLINDLLDLSKIEAQVVRLDDTPFSLIDLLQDVYNITRIKAEEKNLTFQYEMLTPIAETVQGDEGKIKQILINLLNNAVKYTHHGGILLTVSYGTDGPDILRCAISDTGIGIAKEVQEEIFKPFTQLESHGEKIEGTGLGLAITKSLIGFMQGTLNVESEPGKGSTFTVTLPLPKSYAVISREREKRDIIGYEGKRRRVLVVDDNISNADLLVSLLEPLGFEVIVVYNGYDAVSKAINLKPDLILLDLIMAGMDGLDVVHEIRSRMEMNNIRIIGLSAAVSRNDLKHNFIAACDAFLVKPIQVDLLLESMGRQLGLVWKERISDSESGMTDSRTNGKPSMIPDEDTLRRIELTARQGNFTRLSQILSGLEEKDDSFSDFCQKIRQYATKFDDDAIISYIRTIRGKTLGRR